MSVDARSKRTRCQGACTRGCALEPPASGLGRKRPNWQPPALRVSHHSTHTLFARLDHPCSSRRDHGEQPCARLAGLVAPQPPRSCTTRACCHFAGCGQQLSGNFCRGRGHVRVPEEHRRAAVQAGRQVRRCRHRAPGSGSCAYGAGSRRDVCRPPAGREPPACLLVSALSLAAGTLSTPVSPGLAGGRSGSTSTARSGLQRRSVRVWGGPGNPTLRAMPCSSRLLGAACLLRTFSQHTCELASLSVSGVCCEQLPGVANVAGARLTQAHALARSAGAEAHAGWSVSGRSAARPGLAHLHPSTE